MAEQQGQEESGLEVSNASGWKGRIKGPATVCAVVTVIFGIWVVSLLRDHEANAKGFRDDMIAALAKVEAKQQHQAKMIQVQTYVLSLNQREREQLNLARPKELDDLRR